MSPPGAVDARTTLLAFSFLWISQCVGFTIPVVAPFQRLQCSRMLSSRDDDYDSLLHWISGADDRNSQVSLQLSIGTSKYSCGGQGLFVTTDVARGEVLLVVPETHVISVENAWSDEMLGDAFCYLSDEGGDAGRMASLAGFVAMEMLKDKQSHWYPYLCKLPTTMADLDHVLWWSDEDVKSLEGSNIYDKVISLREDTGSAMDILWQVLQTEKSLVLPSKETWDDVLRSAYASILSRSFEDDSVDSSKLIPLLDMTQHSDDANVEHVTDAQRGEVIVKARRDLTSGEELYIEYAHDLDPHEYASLYGFVPGEQKSYRELVHAKSPIFFP